MIFGSFNRLGCIITKSVTRGVGLNQVYSLPFSEKVGTAGKKN